MTKTLWEFDLLVDRDLTSPEWADTLFEAFEGDVTPAAIAGVPMLMCSVEGESFAIAVQTLVVHLLELGIHVERVQAEPSVFAAA